eukprot:COSAG05_NODE_404_length_10192_cov_3.830377_3_plen_86_part_00
MCHFRTVICVTYNSAEEEEEDYKEESQWCVLEKYVNCATTHFHRSIGTRARSIVLDGAPHNGFRFLSFSFPVSCDTTVNRSYLRR